MSFGKCFTLDENHNLVPCDFMECAIWHDENFHKCTVGDTIVAGHRISTVFLGFVHRGGVFETAIFGAADGVRIPERYETWDEAIAGHEKWVASMKRELNG